MRLSLVLFILAVLPLIQYQSLAQNTSPLPPDSETSYSASDVQALMRVHTDFSQAAIDHTDHVVGVVYTIVTVLGTMITIIIALAVWLIGRNLSQVTGQIRKKLLDDADTFEKELSAKFMTLQEKSLEQLQESSRISTERLEIAHQEELDNALSRGILEIQEKLFSAQTELINIIRNETSKKVSDALDEENIRFLIRDLISKETADSLGDEVRQMIESFHSDVATLQKEVREIKHETIKIINEIRHVQSKRDHEQTLFASKLQQLDEFLDHQDANELTVNNMNPNIEIRFGEVMISLRQLLNSSLNELANKHGIYLSRISYRRVLDFVQEMAIRGPSTRVIFVPSALYLGTDE